jgi:predicted permease
MQNILLNPNVFFILVLLLIGKSLSYVKDFPEDTFKVLASYIIYVALPALIFIHMPNLDISMETLTPIMMPWVMLGLSALLVLIIARFQGWSRSITGALMLVVPLGNTSFLGIPMVEAFLGSKAVPYALLYDQLGTFLALATYGSFIVALYAGTERPTFKSVIRRVATFPPFLALLFAFLLRSWQYPDALNAMLHSLAHTLVPVVMIAVGFKISFRLPRQMYSPLTWGLMIKLGVAPLGALILVRWLELDVLAAQVAVLEAGMPAQISAGVVAMSAGLAPSLVAAMVGFGIVLSLGTLPVVHSLI